MFERFFSLKPVHLPSNRARTAPGRRFLPETLERRVLLADVPGGFVDESINTGIDSPTSMDIAPDGKIFVAGQKGHLWVVENGDRRLLTQLANVNSDFERGFLGITVDPNFNSNGFIYVYFTRDGESGTHNRVARFTFDGTNVGNLTTIIDLPNISGAIFHMGGALHFGTDGKLFIAVGDYQNGSNSQSLNTLAGKILRLNSNGTIPTDNPFYNDTTGANRAIWAMGLRNPFTFNIQPGTGRMFINDVGQETWEEINDGAPGANYGWPESEGPNNTSGFTAPIYYYGHNEGCSIGGGVFYPSNATFPGEYQGKYFFADLCSGFIRTLDPNGFVATPFASELSFPVDLDVGPDGSLYYLNRSQEIAGGHIGRIRPEGENGAPSISRQPESKTVSPGGSVTFDVIAQGSGPLNFQWQFNGSNIPGGNSSSYTINNVQSGNAGGYRVVVSNAGGSVTSSTATLTVISGNAPTASIDSPAAGAKFRGGQTFSFSGSASDTEDGQLGAESYTWQVDYHTGSVVRPFVPETTGVTNGTFTIPTVTPFKAANVFYRVRLTVTDSQGLSTTVTRDIQPIVSRVTLRSNVPGVTLFLDGQPKDTPHGADAVAGIRRQLAADPEIEIAGVRYVFDGWSSGGSLDHEFSTPVTDVTYEARYRVKPSVTSTKGLAITIYNNRDRTGTMVTGNVPNLSFDWGEGSPDPNIHRDTFFVRFRGKVQPAFSETYTFYARADDGVRLWVNGEQLIDQWQDSAGEEISASIDLEAGQKYDLRFDYFENMGLAFAELLWSSPSTPKGVIPKSRLFSTIMPQTIVPTDDSFVQGGVAVGSNFDDRTTLITKTVDGDRLQRDAYVKFNVGNLDLANMGAAKLRFFGRLSGEDDINIRLGLYQGTGSWSEQSITWENRPPVKDKLISHVTVTNNQNQWHEFDITNFLRQQKELGRNILTFVLRNIDESMNYTLLYSRESPNAPHLIVTI